MHILVFSASIGHGHNQVARAIQEEAPARGHSAEIIDVLEFVSPFLSRVVLESYLRMLRYTPFFYGKLYELSEEPVNMEYASIVNSLLCRGFQRLLEREQPCAIVCSHSFAVGLLTALKQRLKLDLPVLVTVTDFTVHPSWVHDGVDYYIIANHKLLHLMENLQVEAECVVPTGIPLRRQFRQPTSKSTARNRLGLPDSPTVLLMGGGLGLGLNAGFIQSLALSLPNHQLLVTAGQNRSVIQKLARGALQDRVHVLAYVEEMADYMAASDLLITKPGGVTCAEALSRHLPMALFSPIPGQEDRNATFLTDQMVAVQFDSNNLSGRLSDLVTDAERLATMSHLAARLARPNATEDLFNLIETFV